MIVANILEQFVRKPSKPNESGVGFTSTDKEELSPQEATKWLKRVMDGIQCYTTDPAQLAPVGEARG